MASALAQLQGSAQLRMEAAPAPCSRLPASAQRVVQRRRLQRRGGSMAVVPARAAVAAAAPAARISAEDKWIERTLEAVAPDSATLPAPLAALQSTCASALATARMPTTRNEEYRYTDVSPVTQQAVVAAAGTADTPAAALDAAVSERGLTAAAAATVVVVDGQIDAQRSSLGGLPQGVYVGGLAGAPQDVVSFALGAQSRSRGGAFAALNGAAARDAVVVHVPSDTTLAAPIHVMYLSSGAAAGGAAPAAGQATAAAPRLLAVLEEGASAEIVEEFGCLGGGASDAAAPGVSALTSAVAEFELDDRAALKHSYVVLEGASAAHMKATLVNQGRESSYSLVEVRVGGRLTRHDVSIDQLGEATQSQMRSFLLCGEAQLHDLHSKLKLDHPQGEADQLHKCIVSSPSGRGVFDGNVQVNRLAQKTDAQQLSRNLLLVPRATVNVKPNLQIIADDVKCTHGCTVSDLEEEELFYLRSRGISAEAARQMLVYSFGREVVQGLRDEALQARVEAAMRGTLLTFAAAP